MLRRRRPVRSAAALALVAMAAVSVSACGEDSDDAASSTTATSERVTSTTTTTMSASSDSDPSSPTSQTTTTLSGTDVPGQLDVYIGSEQRLPVIDDCTVGAGSVDLTATDPAGNTLTVTVKENTGGVTYRGPSEDREGSVRTADVRADGSFVLRGIISVADDSAPAPVDLQIAGRCAP